MVKKVNIVCMKWGSLYSPDYVNKLFCMVKRNLTRPFNFYCLTDNAFGIKSEVIVKPLPEIYVPAKNQVSPWRKLGMFSKDLYGITGKTLFLDLDLIIINNIDELFDYTDKFAIIENWTQKGQAIGNSSVYCFNAGEYPFVLDAYVKDPELAALRNDNEQIFLSKLLANDITFFPDDWFKSFKRHCVAPGFLRFFKSPVFPDKAKIIVFHGQPRPHQALLGIWPKKLIPRLKPASWIGEYWKEN